MPDMPINVWFNGGILDREDDSKYSNPEGSDLVIPRGDLVYWNFNDHGVME